jgi:BCL2/adenovirus E1B protein-interacting protein 3
METPPGSSSWVDLSQELNSGLYPVSSSVSPCRTNPTTPLPFGNDQDYMSMLKEAQKETSCRSSARVSPLNSTLVSQRTSPCLSPKSPPNSPRTEIADFSAEFRDVFINKVREIDTMTDFMWDWSSTPVLPKDWKCGTQTPGVVGYRGSSGSSRPEKKRSVSTLYTVSTFLMSNLVSLLLGAGLGAWLYRRSTSTIRVL